MKTFVKCWFYEQLKPKTLRVLENMQKFLENYYLVDYLKLNSKQQSN